MAENLTLHIEVQDDGSAVIKDFQGNVRRLGDDVQNSSKSTESGFARMNKSVTEFGSSAAVQMGMAGALGAIVGFVGKSVTSLAEFEDIMVDVQKTTGMAAPEVQKLGDALRDMAIVDLQGVVGADALGQIAASAGSLGINGAPKIEAFTLAIAEMSVAAEMGAGETATSMAELENSFRTGLEKAGQSAESQTANIGSAFNALENTTSATTAQILDMTRRMAGAADTIGLTIDQTSAIAATLKSVGVDVEVGGTAMSKFFLDMLQNSGDWATKLKLDASDVSNAMKNDPVQAIQMVVKGMGELKNTEGPAALAAALDDLGVKDTRLIDAMLKLSGASTQLDANIRTSNEAFKAGTSLHDEFLVKASSSVSQWQGLGEKSKEVFRSFGTELKPATEMLTTWAAGGLDVVIAAARAWAGGVREEFFDALVESAETAMDGVKTAFTGGFSEIEYKEEMEDIYSAQEIGIGRVTEATVKKTAATQSDLDALVSLKTENLDLLRVNQDLRAEYQAVASELGSAIEKGNAPTQELIASTERLKTAMAAAGGETKQLDAVLGSLRQAVLGVDDAYEGNSLTPATYNYVKAARAANDETEMSSVKFKDLAEQVDFADQRAENLTYGLNALRQATEDAAAAQAEANAEFQQTYAEDLAQGLNTLRDAYEETYEAAEYPESALLSMRAATGIIQEQEVSLQDLAGAFEGVAGNLGTLSSGIGDIGGLFDIDTSGIESFLGKAQGLAELPGKLSGMKDAFTGMFDGLKGIGDIFSGGGLGGLLSGGGLSSLLGGLSSIAPIAGIVAAAWGPIKDLFGNLFENTKSKGTEAALAMQDLVKSGVSGGAELAAAMGTAFDTMSANNFNFEASLQATGSTMSQVMGGISANWQQGSTAMDVFTQAVGRATGDMEKAPQVALQMMMGFDQMGLSAEQAGAKMVEIATAAGMSTTQIEALKAALAGSAEEGGMTTTVFDGAGASVDALSAKTGALGMTLGGVTAQLAGTGAEGALTSNVFTTAQMAASGLDMTTATLSGNLSGLTGQLMGAGAEGLATSNVFTLTQGTSAALRDDVESLTAGVYSTAQSLYNAKDQAIGFAGALTQLQSVASRGMGGMRGYASGGFPTGLAIVNEAGSEIADIPGVGMALMTARGPALGAFPPGTEIIPHSRSMQILRDYPNLPRMASGGTVEAMPAGGISISIGQLVVQGQMGNASDMRRMADELSREIAARLESRRRSG